MEKFLVKVCKGIVKNVRKGTVRTGYWIPVETLPWQVAQQFGADKDKARPTLAWDTHSRGWRDMANASKQGEVIANAVVVEMDDGSRGIALLDF